MGPSITAYMTRERKIHLFFFALLVIIASSADAELKACEVGFDGLCIDDGTRTVAKCNDTHELCKEWADLGMQESRR